MYKISHVAEDLLAPQDSAPWSLIPMIIQDSEFVLKFVSLTRH